MRYIIQFYEKLFQKVFHVVKIFRIFHNTKIINKIVF
jgi:hypothetical protein